MSLKHRHATKKNFRGKEILKIETLNFSYPKVIFIEIENCTDHFHLNQGLCSAPDFFYFKKNHVTAPIKLRLFFFLKKPLSSAKVLSVATGQVCLGLKTLLCTFAHMLHASAVQIFLYTYIVGVALFFCVVAVYFCILCVCVCYCDFCCCV